MFAISRLSENTVLVMGPNFHGAAILTASRFSTLIAVLITVYIGRMGAVGTTQSDARATTPAYEAKMLVRE